MIAIQRQWASRILSFSIESTSPFWSYLTSLLKIHSERFRQQRTCIRKVINKREGPSFIPHISLHQQEASNPFVCLVAESIGKKAINPKSIPQLNSTTCSTARRSFELAITFESCTYLTLQQIKLLQFHPVCHFRRWTTPPLEHSSKRDLRNHSTGHPMSGRLMQLVTG